MIFANNVDLGGHVTIGDFAVFGGQQPCVGLVRIGEGRYGGGAERVRADVIPFGSSPGSTSRSDRPRIVVGMRRRGSSKAEIHRLRQALKPCSSAADVSRAPR